MIETSSSWPIWRTSSYSAGAQQCVEVARTATGEYLVRDSKHPDHGTHQFDENTWHAFIQEMKSR